MHRLEGQWEKIYFNLLMLHVDDKLFTTNDTKHLLETNHMLFSHFDMWDHGQGSYVLGIQILSDTSNSILGLSQETYINCVLRRSNMQSCSPRKAPIVKGDKLSKSQYPP